jgi:hypothetical protein
MRTAGQTTTGQGGSPISVIPNSLPTVAPSKTPQTFRSDGTQFTYPGSYTLYTGTAQVPVPSPTCQSAVAYVVYPRDRYSGTNFSGAWFEERVIDDATTRGVCLTSPMRAPNYPEFRVAKDPGTINGVRFLHGISTDVGLSQYTNTDLYRAFQRGKCYELSITIASSSFGSFDPGTVREFTSKDDQRVRSELTTILNSFRFMSSRR